MFPYLGSLIAEVGECMIEFCTRLNRGQAIGASLQKIWKDHSENETNESGSMACSSVCLRKLHTKKE